MAEERQYERPIQIGEGVFWVGFYEQESNLHCNPYLLVGGDDQAAVIDGGSRPDFPVVMTKILQSGLNPKHIRHLIYQHYDPDLCGSIPHFIDMCDNPELQILSHAANNLFLRYYTVPEHHHLFTSIRQGGGVLDLGGRRLRFIEIPYCHTTGSFVTYDEQTKILFTSDLFGSFSRQWDLYLNLNETCTTCDDYGNCPAGRSYCPVGDIVGFHRYIMTSGKALANAMRTIRQLDVEMIAPQHGSLVVGRGYIHWLIDLLENLTDVGIDKFC